MATDAATKTAQAASEMPPQLDTAIAVLKANDMVASWNPRAAHLTGYTLEALNTVGFTRIFEPVETMQQLIQKAQGGISAASARAQLRRADGLHTFVDVECSPLLHGEHGEEWIVVAMRELVPAQRHLGSAPRLQMLSHLARSLSHEIRNPVNAIFLHTDILEEELRQPALNTHLQVEQSLGTIKAEVMRLNDRVQDYLALVRLSDLRREPEDLGAFLGAFIRELHDQLTDRTVNLRVEGLEGLGTVAVHRSLLRRALLNLIQYVMEAMPQGGSLVLRGWRTASHVHLAVHDVGKILQTDRLPLLVRPAHATELEGSALGFYVAQEIVAAHSGAIETTSEPGEGTTLVVTLPLKETEDAANS